MYAFSLRTKILTNTITKMKTTIKTIAILMASLLAVPAANAQAWLDNHTGSVNTGNRHLLLNFDLYSGNVYTFAVSTIAFGFLNDAFKQNVLETGFVADITTAQYDTRKISTHMWSPVGVQARELFNDINPNLKIGWKSSSYSSANIGVFANLGYKLHQFSLRADDQAPWERLRYQRIYAGVGVQGIFGGLESPYRVIVEGAVRYVIPTALTTTAWSDVETTQLSKGVQTHWAVKMGGADAFQNIGLFVDIDHFNLIDKGWAATDGSRPFNDFSLKNITLGITMSVSFGQAEKR